MLLNPLQLGSITLPNRLVQAPLAGYSCAPFRALTTRLGNPGFCTTEMISAKDLKHRNPKPKRYLWRDPEEKILCYQISGREVDDIAFATNIMTEVGADIIDLNCGCPVKKIRAKGSGSKLLQEPELIYQLVQTMKENTSAVISIKIRVGEPLQDSHDIEVAEAAQTGGADFIIVHGRHWSERYDVPSRQDEIGTIVKAVTIPVFANGDVDDASSAVALQQNTGCAGIMIARASVGNPWLFQQIQCELSKGIYHPPSRAEIAATFLEHIEKLIELENERLAVLQSRKLAKYYSRALNKRSEFVTEMQQATSFKDIRKLIDEYLR